MKIFCSTPWHLEKGHNYFIVKADASIIAFKIGKNVENPSIHIVASHNDSPMLKIKPNGIIYQNGYTKLNTEIYGGAIYSTFMDKSGLFDLMQNHLISNLVDYVTGVETGLDSNGRKNRGGHLMEDLVELYIQKAGFVKDKNYFKEMYISDIAKKWNINLSAISNQGKMEKRFDYVVKTERKIYAIETNFYGSGGSKLNETARSYKTIANEAKMISGFEFVWFTDGFGWASAKNNLEETFDVLNHIYCIQDMEAGIMKEIFR